MFIAINFVHIYYSVTFSTKMQYYNMHLLRRYRYIGIYKVIFYTTNRQRIFVKGQKIDVKCATILMRLILF